MANLSTPRARASLNKIQIYVPGRSLADVRRELGIRSLAKLASNENPLGPSPKALRAAARALGESHRYPEGGAPLLRRALAKHFGLSPEHLIVGAGSNEILVLAALAYAKPGQRVVYSESSFAVYGIATRIAGATPKILPSPDLAHDLQGLASAAKQAALIFVCNPNNPTGSWYDDATLLRFIRKIPRRCLIVLDEAYAEYCGRSTKVDAAWVRRFPNLLIARTFSKAYGLAGLRMGYGVGQPSLLRPLESVRQPFNTSSLAQAAALAALGDQAHVRRSVTHNTRERARLSKGLRELGMKVWPSKANFILFDQPAPSAPGGASWEAYFLSQGLILRAALPGRLRVSVGLVAENGRFLKALARGLKGNL